MTTTESSKSATSSSSRNRSSAREALASPKEVVDRVRARLKLTCNVPHGVVATIDVPLCFESENVADGEGIPLSRTAMGSRSLDTVA